MSDIQSFTGRNMGRTLSELRRNQLHTCQKDTFCLVKYYNLWESNSNSVN